MEIIQLREEQKRRG